ncbi:MULTISPECIES: hypothetical protein [Streptomyces]|nr:MULTISPECIES: hypothetical protein [Streptomyces]UUA09094.1 hypothetical protein NNW98_27770 [Streptomyces koelreuteriae]UUA16699.1 hypothetical protein NNW99_27655 [Streptomyces sp. CRCS-T-1]
MVTRDTEKAIDPYAAVESLRTALGDVGVRFPSLGVDLGSPELKLIELGRIGAAVALRLADVLRAGGGVSAGVDLRVDAMVVDTHGDRLGFVAGFEGPCVRIRPVAGGRGWDADPVRVRPATEAERLAALGERNHALNLASGRRWLG